MTPATCFCILGDFKCENVCFSRKVILDFALNKTSSQLFLPESI